MQWQRIDGAWQASAASGTVYRAVRRAHNDDGLVWTLYANGTPCDGGRLMAAAPALLSALEELLDVQKGREDWPEVQAAEDAIRQATATPK